MLRYFRHPDSDPIRVMGYTLEVMLEVLRVYEEIHGQPTVWVDKDGDVRLVKDMVDVALRYGIAHLEGSRDN